MINDDKLNKLRDLLEAQYEWPAVYTFKFIAPKDKVHEVEALFPGVPLEKKNSRNGNYVSVTVSMELPSPDHVIAVYEQAAKVEGLISL